MPVSVTEGWKSRTVQRGSGESIELLYTVTGTDDDATAETELLAVAPATHRTLNLTDYRVEETTKGVWKGTLTYKPFNPIQKDPETLGSSTGEVSYTTGSATARRLQSISTIYSATDAGFFGIGVDPPDFGGLIGVNRDGAEGVEINIPAPTFRETHTLTPASVTAAYLRTVAKLAYKVNNATFKGFSAGEVLFVGAEFHARDNEAVIGTYDFQISENKTGLTVGGMTGIDKDGWDYLWILYNDDEDAAAEYLVKKPTAVYVERVYDRADLSALQIGT